MRIKNMVVELLGRNVEVNEENGFARICDKDDYKAVFNDFLENGAWAYETKFSFEKFMEEFNKGYAGSDYMEIARYVQTDDGIWFENEYYG